MNDAAYDISHLLESESFDTPVPQERVARPAPKAVPSLSGIATAEAMITRELREVAEVHDEWVRQFLDTRGTASASV
ncbi:MAG TPA: hypothetical protein VIL60_07020 [Rhodanobacter sp.]